MKKDNLEVGQRIWLERVDFFSKNKNEDRKVSECEVVEANKTSAYAVEVDKLEAFKEEPNKYGYRKRKISQRTHEVKGDGFGSGFILWMSESDFNEDLEEKEEVKAARQKAQELVNKLSLEELSDFLNQFNKD